MRVTRQCKIRAADSSAKRSRASRRDADVVALTFDDGPNGDDTAAILDVLREENVRATFFLVGKAVAEQPEILQCMIRDGHALGNHTWDHAHLNVRTRAGITRQLQRADDAIYAATGTRTTTCASAVRRAKLSCPR